MELDGMVNQYRLLSELFPKQARRWESIARCHMQLIFRAASTHLSLVTDHLANRETVTRIRAELISKAMADKEKRLMDKLQELVTPHQEWRPVTLNQNYQKLVFDSNSLGLHSAPPDIDLKNRHAMQQYVLTLNHLQNYYDVSAV
jgi:hypothetical protein